MKKNLVKIFLVTSLAMILVGCAQKSKTLTIDEAETKVLDFFKENGATQIEINDIQEEGCCLYKIATTNQGQEADMYLSKDGELFFLQGLKTNMEEVQKEQEAARQEQKEQYEKSLETIPKTDRPNVELFVMSHCPYGTQIEKGILPVIKTLGDKIDFELKFVDYAMHEDTEIKEQIRQYCIQKNMPDKFLGYLECFLEDGNSDRCIEKMEIDKARLDTCFSQTDTQFKLLETYQNQDSWGGNKFPPFNIHKEDNTKYEVSGSPTFVINGTKFSTMRDPNSLLKSVCAGFNEKPAECDTELSDQIPSAGFGQQQNAAGGNSGGGECG